MSPSNPEPGLPENNQPEPLAGSVIQPDSSPGSSPEPAPQAQENPLPPAAANHPLFQSSTPAFTPPPVMPPLQPPRRSRKKRLLLLALPVLLLGAGAAAYFGYFLPNTPDNLWAKALSNTGKGYDKLAQYALTTKYSKGVSVKGSFKAIGDTAADGNFEGNSSGNNAVYKGSISASGLKVGLEIRTISTDGNTPDIYFKADGLQGLGTLLGGDNPQISQALNGLNGQWYFVDHTFFDQFASGANTNTQLTSSDVSSVLKAVGDANKQYIFTSDKQKMAFTLKQRVGKEKQDNRSVYHYKASVNKQNLKKYVSALCDNLKKSKLTKLFNGSSEDVDNALGCADLTKSIDKFDESRTADVWVDTRTKLIHKVRFTEKNKPGSYWEIGQDYQGGDEFPFTLAFNDKTEGGKLTTRINFKLNTATGVFSLDGNSQSSETDKQSFDYNLTVAPSNTSVKVEAPAGAKTIIELLNDLGFSDFFTGTQDRAKDTERRVDINALHSQLEVFYAENGYYPALAQVNDPNWRRTNMPGYDDEALKDPEGGQGKLVAAPQAKAYAYQVSPANCNGTSIKCTDYTLTATLDDGSTYSKKALGSETDSTILQ
jgi:type II secretory pathway pseudopilin PulG